VGLVLVFSLLHYAIFTVTYVRSVVVHPEVNWTPMQAAARVLSFPLGYLANLGLPIDIFPVMIVVNSLLWGIACTGAVIWCLRRGRRHKADRVTLTKNASLLP
jgi:hypothetical protein